MICKLCRVERHLIDAHIIPKPFFGEVDSGRHRAKVLSNRVSEYPRRLPIGPYDQKLLCAACDNAIGRWDAYDIKVLLHERDQLKPYPSGDAPFAFVRDHFDYSQLKLFFLSVLWRAHESSLPFFQRVRLGPYRNRLYEMISGSDPGQPDEFAVFLSAFTVNNQIPDAGTPILDPHRDRWNGVTAYRISFGVITAYIKVDKVPFREPFVDLILRPEQQLIITAREFREGAEGNVMRSIVQSPQNQRAFPRRAQR